MSVNSRRCYLRHAWEAFPHVGDDVDDHPPVLFHPRGVDCVERPANNQTESFQKHKVNQVFAVCFSPSLQQWKVPVRLVSITAFQPLDVMCSAGLVNWPPPLFTRKSILPCRFSTDDTRVFTCHTGGVKTRGHNEILQTCTDNMLQFQRMRVCTGLPHPHFGCYTVGEWRTQGWREGFFVSAPELLPPTSPPFCWRSPHCNLSTI